MCFIYLFMSPADMRTASKFLNFHLAYAKSFTRIAQPYLSITPASIAQLTKNVASTNSKLVIEVWSVEEANHKKSESAAFVKIVDFKIRHITDKVAMHAKSGYRLQAALVWNRHLSRMRKHIAILVQFLHQETSYLHKYVICNSRHNTVW